MRGFLLSIGAVLLFHSAQAHERLPVVFAHGLGVTPSIYEEVVQLKKVFNELGYQVYVAQTPFNRNIETRAKILKDEIDRLLPQGQYHIIAHSMGGLDARLAIQKYQLAPRCVSLTTIATPHRGSEVADLVMEYVRSGRSLKPFEEFLKLLDHSIEAVEDLTTQHLNSDFNQRVTDDERVKYYSLNFYIPKPVRENSPIAWLWLTHQMISWAGYPLNDGLVSVESSHWGTSLGDFQGDHVAETAQSPFAGKLIYKDVFEAALKNLDENF